MMLLSYFGHAYVWQDATVVDRIPVNLAVPWHAVADRLGAGFAPVRKKGKLPSHTVQETYDLEYGTDCLEIHCDAFEPGHKVLLVAADTFRAAAIEQLGTWAERIGCEIVKNAQGSDPASVAHDACERALARKVDYLIIDSTWAGGLTTWRKAAVLAELYQIPMAAHHDPQIHVHAVAASPTGFILESFADSTRDPLWFELFQERPKIVDGFMALPDAPGPDLLALIVGSEGTLAIVTKVVVRILRKPESVQTLLAAYNTISEAGAAQPGNTCLFARLTELLFIEVLRRHMAGLPPGAVGWLAALNDPLVGRALQLMHAQPAYPWTVDDLARQCAASRSLLAERFKTLLGQPPMHYLACWRLQLAAQMLRDGVQGIAAIAARTGYESESAFNRAFKRHAGEPPAAWRAKTLAMSGAHPRT